MKLKKGVTVAMLAIMVLVLSILTASIVTTVSKSINNTNLMVWTQEIGFVQDIMNETKDKDDVLLNEIQFNVSNITSQVLTEQFKDEAILNNVFSVYEINLTKLNMPNTVYGKYDSERDVYVYSKETGRVYYLAGFNGAKGNIYYTITDELRNKYDNQDATNTELTTIVFNASSVKYTSDPISVVVNVPNTYTEVTVTTSNSNVVVGEKVEENGKYTYLVNTQNYGSNYEVTVKYNDGTEKVASYVVDVYDDTAPIILSAQKTDSTITVDATDEFSGIKEMRYIIGDMPETDIQEYFKTNGTRIINTFKVGTNVSKIIIYIEDNAGNYSTKEI